MACRLSATSNIKPDFPHFDYANPDAPKGGTFNFSPPNWVYNQNPLTFNTLNTLHAEGRRAAAHGACASTR